MMQQSNAVLTDASPMPLLPLLHVYMPLLQAIMAQPPNTINGRFRVTEQGEMITQNFGNVGIAGACMRPRVCDCAHGVDVCCCCRHMHMLF
jgi:Phosphoenolpyruvate carboxylase